MKQSRQTAFASNFQGAKTGINSRQYGTETRTTAISQNSFVGRFETTLFSQNAAG
jgi:hypothetical protein